MADDKQDVVVQEPKIDVSKIESEIASNVKESVKEDLTYEIAEKVSSQVRDNLVEQIGGKKEEEWIPKSYEEIKEVTKREIREEREAEEAKRAEEAKIRESEKDRAAKEAESQQHSEWDRQLKELEESGKIPKISDEVQAKLDKKEKLTSEDQQDEGVKARIEMYKLAQESKEPNLKVVYYEQYEKPKDQRPGANVPVFGTQRGGSANDEVGYSYEEISNARSLRDLME